MEKYALSSDAPIGKKNDSFSVKRTNYLRHAASFYIFVLQLALDFGAVAREAASERYK